MLCFFFFFFFQAEDGIRDIGVTGVQTCALPIWPGCAVEATLDLIDGKWKGVILFHLQAGTQRFGELRRRMPGITQRMLTKQLRALEDDRLVIRKVYAEVPPRVEYTLSDIGESLRPVIETLRAWGEGHQERLSCAPVPDALTKPDRAA